ncbi:MAG: RNase adapter RapZ, partial [Bacillota bacterium]
IGVQVRILFMDASDEVLIRRFNETRRQHPMAMSGRVVEGIERERLLLQPLKERANLVLDTSVFSVKQLRAVIREEFMAGEMADRVLVSVVTFGFKRGIPIDADMVFDVRFLPNPFYIQELKHHSGIDEDVASYIFSFEQTGVFLHKLVDMIDYLLPYYQKEDKNQLVVAIGCTGGMHRSVAIAEALYKELEARGMRVSLAHRDLGKDA